MHEDNDATRVAPVDAARRDHDDDRTVVKPVSDAPSTRTGTGTQSGSIGTSEAWERLATLAPGESPTVGTVLKGRFFLERELGRGGMGVVFLARDERKVEARDRDPYVAVKVLNDQFRKHPDSLIALQREARRAQQFANDHIVRVYDFDKDGSNVFMTMEYVEGSDLRALMRSRGRDGLAFAEAWPLIEGMARALQRAHEAGVVHSDFKPGNVMVTAAGVAKVFDFGIARAGHAVRDGNVPRDGHDDETVFDAGTLGAMTPAYASLAMLRGEPPTPADDVYAFGCVVAELLTGRHPFAKKTAEEALGAGLRPPVVPGLDKRQQKALADALALTAERRTADIATVLAGLRRRRLRERATPWVAAAVVAGVVAAGGAWYASHRAEQQHVADTLRRFDPAQPDAFTGEDQVRQGLGSLTGDERRRVVVDGADTIDHFLMRQLAAHWDPAKGRLDYAGAERTFALRAELKTFAPKFDRRRDEVVHEREDQLNRLDTALSEAILAGRLFGDGAEDVPAILGRVRSIDPASRLLANPELELKFGMAIEASQQQGDTAGAEKQLAIARAWFPASSRLATIAGNLKAPGPATSAAMPTPSPVQDGTDLAIAERTSRLESLRHASAAGDLDKALASFRALNAGATAPPPADDEAAGLLAQAALAAARNACAAGRWKDAAASVQTALDATGERTDLRRAKTRYDLAVAVMNAAKAPSVSSAEQDDLSKRLQAARQDDAAGMKDMEAAMVASKGLPEGTLDNVVKKLRATEVVGPVAGTPRDPCGRKGLAGTARECFDTFAVGSYGPAMVVIPNGRKPFAMMRTEATVANLDQFCRATRTCAINRGQNANDPARSIPVDFARRYAAWLTQISGHVYRLPTEQEWLTAARGGANWDGENDACGEASSALGRLIHSPELGPATGKANPWGLVGVTGGVWEWVTRGSALVARGGSFRSGPAQCSVNSARASDGTADRDVGFRLVREIR